MSLDPYALTIICIGLAIGSFVKGLTGMGLPLIAVPFLAGFLGAEHSVVVMQIPGLVSNAWLVWSQRGAARTAPPRYDLVVPAFLTLGFGVWFLNVADDRVAILLLAGCVAAFLLLLLAKPEFRLDGRLGRILTPIASAVGGFAQGATGVSAPLFSTLIFSFRLPKETFVFYNGLIFGIFNLIQISVMVALGMFTWERTLEGCLALIPLFLFQYIGMKTMGLVSPGAFNRIVIAVVAAMEIKLVWHAIGG